MGPDGRVLVVDDEPMIMQMLVQHLRDAGYDADGAEGVEEALALAGRNGYRLAVVDRNMPGRAVLTEGGIELMGILRDRHPECALLAITGQPDERGLLAMRAAGAVRCLAKPFSMSGFLTAVGELMADPRGDGMNEPARGRADRG